jgi:putative ABC transport system substrate-binding protein
VDRRAFAAGIAGAFLASRLAAEAQPRTSARVGFLVSQAVTTMSLEAFKNGLRELGWTERENLALEVRSPEDDPGRLPGLAAELVRLPVDVLVASAAPASVAAKQATTTIPIVSVYTLDPVTLGLVKSLARPGGNITGLSAFSLEYAGKMLELLKSVVPNASRVAMLGDPTNPSHAIYWRQFETSARILQLALVRADVRRPEDFDSVFARVTGGPGTQCLLVMHQPLTFVHRKRIVRLAEEHRLPAVYGSREAAEDGGLIAFGPSMPAIYRRAAAFVDRILKGAKPAAMPVEQPTEFELVINLRTAKALRLAVPPTVLARAHEVIE